MPVSLNTQKILMRLSYLQVPPEVNDRAIRGGVVGFDEVFAAMMGFPINRIEPQMATARKLNAVLDNHPELLRLRFLGQQTHDKGGFSAMAYGDTDGERVAAFRGSNRPLDYIDDWQMTVRSSDSQLLDAIDFYDTFLRRPNGSPVRLAGHSLGGGLATYLFILVAPTRNDVFACVVNSAFFPTPDTDSGVGILASERYASYSDVGDALYKFYQVMAKAPQAAQAINDSDRIALTVPQNVIDGPVVSVWPGILDVYETYMRKNLTDNAPNNPLRGHMTIAVDL